MMIKNKNHTFKLRMAASNNNTEEKNYSSSGTSSISPQLNLHTYPQGLSKYNIIIESPTNVTQHKIN